MADHDVAFPVVSPLDRAALRRRMIAWRESLPDEVRHQHEALINERLTHWLDARAPGVIAFCWPIRKEIDCRPTVLTLLRRGWQAAIPVVVARDAPMEFRRWWPDAPMGEDPYGIPVPLTETAPPPDVVLVPLVAFDAVGFRLGYGGGYFDRTLALLSPRPLVIGVGFSGCAVASIEPAPHDLPMDIIVTENTMKFISLRQDSSCFS